MREAAALERPAAERSSRPVLRIELGAITVLLRRDLVRFFRQRSRVLGALAQPLLFWAILGAGLGRAFRVPGAESTGYLEYFYPGVLLLVVLFTSIFSTMSVIEDRREGLLQAVLVAPATRGSLVLGKTLGGVAIALAQAVVLLALCPLAGFPFGRVDWGLLLGVLLLTSVALTALGFTFAWWLDSVQGYHAVMSVLLIPAWVLSGAMFPATSASRWIGALMQWNPLSYAVDGVRRALYGARIPAGLELGGLGAGGDVLVLAGLAVLALTAAIAVCARRV